MCRPRPLWTRAVWQPQVCSRECSPPRGDQTAAWGQQQAARTVAKGEAALDLRLSAGCPHLLYLMLSSE